MTHQPDRDIDARLSHGEEDSRVTSRPDVQAATSLMRERWRARRPIANLPDHLDDNESVLKMAVGSRSALEAPGVLVLTDRRLLFVKNGVIRKSTESIPLDLITGVALKSGVSNASIKTQGAQSMEVIGEINKKDAAALVAELRRLINARSHSAMGTSSQPVDVASQLEKLARLRDQGVLTGPEFQAQKDRLLSSN
jgi:hypothetical protein